MRRRISIFGATGSIGKNTVALIEAAGGAEAFDIVALTGHGNIALLAEQARRLRARLAVTADPAQRDALVEALAGTATRVEAGPEALVAAAAEPVDWAMSSIVGAAGLAPSLELARHGGILALANKESMVCAGALMRQTCARHGTRLIPADSEHSAIFQALRGGRAEEVDRIILTASGGPFRDWTPRQMAQATPEQACAHPTWAMGKRISIDSATMFNKALEIIEARELFEFEPDRIDVVVHPQSVVHALVEYRDGSILAQLGPSDMKGVIGFALNWPDRRPLPMARLDLTAIGRLDFLPADPERFPALRLARQVLEMGGLTGAVFNAAKEVALDTFLLRAIGFLDMAVLVEHVLEAIGPQAAAQGTDYCLADVMALDAEARRLGVLWVEAFGGK